MNPPNSSQIPGPKRSGAWKWSGGNQTIYIVQTSGIVPFIAVIIFSAFTYPSLNAGTAAGEVLWLIFK
jgi:hypothetical protein